MFGNKNIFIKFMIGTVLVLFLIKAGFLILVLLFFLLVTGKLNGIKSVFSNRQPQGLKHSGHYGKVYRFCDSCGAKSDRKSIVCSGCSRPFE